MRGLLRCLIGPRLRGAGGAAGRIGLLLYVALLTVLAAAVFQGFRALRAG